MEETLPVYIVWLHLMERIVILFFLMLGIFTASQVYAQVQDLQFNHLTSNNGLSHSNVICILQDKRGFMWFGTRNGLNKFDGYNFKIYRNSPKDTNSLSGNTVFALTEDHHGNIWVATEGTGLDKYNPITDTFTHFTHTPDTTSLSNNFINALFTDRYGNVWIGTNNGLNVLKKGKNSFVRYLTASHNNNKSRKRISAIDADGNGDIWIGTRNDGLYVLNPAKDTFQHYTNDSTVTSLSDNDIRVIHKDNSGTMWIGTNSGGLNRFDQGNNIFIHYEHQKNNPESISNNTILTLESDPEGNIWVGTEMSGINVLHKNKHTFKRYQREEGNQHSLTDNDIYAIYTDQTNNIWIGTYNGGINFLNKARHPFEHYFHRYNGINSLSYNAVLSFLEDDEHTVWIGTDGDGINVFNRQKNIFTHYKYNPDNPQSISADIILSLWKDQEGVIWIGTWGGGLCRFDKRTNSFFRYSHTNNRNSLSNNNAWVVYEDKRRNLWIGTYGGGLNLMDRKTGTFINYKHDETDTNSLSNDMVMSMMEDSQGNLWMGTNEGLNLFDRDKGTFISYKHDRRNNKSLSNNKVRTIFEDSQGNLWLGTFGGLNRFDKKTQTFYTYREEDGLSNDVVTGILEDAHKNLWISTNNGISKFNLNTKHITNYSVLDGLQSNDFRYPAYLKSHSGEMYMGGVNGFNVFHPDSIKNNPHIPPVIITGFQIFNKPVLINGVDSPLKRHISESKEITLSHKHSVFTFEFTALNYSIPEKNQYAYKLEGFDKDWNYVGNIRTATYTNLDPRDYVFKVKAANNDGIWNQQGTSLRITITPPFWQTWLFRLTTGMLLLGSALTFYGVRVSAIKAQREKLRHQNEELKKINAELDSFVYRASHDLRAPLTSILGLINITKAENNEASKAQYLSLMEKSINKLDTFIQSIINYSRNSRMEIKRERIDFATMVEETFEELKYMDNAGQVQKKVSVVEKVPFYCDGFRLKIIFNNLISNAIRYRNSQVESYLRIHVEVDAYRAKVVVADNGCGIARESIERIFEMFYRASSSNVGSGLGLYIVKEAITTLGGSIQVQSQLDKGTTFTIELRNAQKPNERINKDTLI